MASLLLEPDSWEARFLAMETAMERSPVMTRESALPFLRFLEGVRGLIARPLAQWPTTDQLRAHLSDPDDYELVELLEDARDSLHAEPESRLSVVMALDVFTAQLRGCWAVAEC